MSVEVEFSCADPRGCQNPDMCHTIESCDRYGEVARERERERLPMPQCCTEATLGRAVYPRLGEKGQPEWAVIQSDRLRRVLEPKNIYSSHRARFCPFCGAGLPELALSETPPVPLCRPDASECYCETCGDRGPCACYPPICAYEIVTP